MRTTFAMGVMAAATLAAACSPAVPSAVPLEVLALEPEPFFAAVPNDARARLLAEGLPYVEGPVWLPAEGGVLFSAMRADALMLWHPERGLSTWRSPSGRANGNALDREGRLVTCEHAARRVSRTLADGTVETLAECHEGRRLSSPNDVAVRADGTIWFTDPPYGLVDAPRELDGNYVFQLDPDAGVLAIAVDRLELPNGIAFAPDSRTVYVTDSGAPRAVWAFGVGGHAPGSPSRISTVDGARAIHRLPADGSRGEPDGLAVAADGTLFVAVGDGLDVLAPDGRHLGTLRVPAAHRPVRNVCFGGTEGRTLFLTAGSALLAVEVRVSGP